jgi:hypothetical protein
MLATPVERTGTYESPALVELGTLQELTLVDCIDKKWGSSDGLTMMGSPITCNSA